MDKFIDFVFEKVIMPVMTVLCLVAGLFLLALPVLFFIDSKDAKYITLDEREFTCTDTQRYTSSTMVKSGNVYVPITTHHTRCNQWTRSN